MDKTQEAKELTDFVRDTNIEYQTLKLARKNPLLTRFADYAPSTNMGSEFIALLNLSYLSNSEDWEKITNSYALKPIYSTLTDSKMLEILKKLGYSPRMEQDLELSAKKEESSKSYVHKLNDENKLWVFSRDGTQSPLRKLTKTDNCGEEFVAIYKRKEQIKSENMTEYTDRKTIFLGSAKGEICPILKKIIKHSYESDYYSNSAISLRDGTEKLSDKVLNWYSKTQNAIFIGGASGLASAYFINPNLESLAWGIGIGIAQAPIWAYCVRSVNQNREDKKNSKLIPQGLSEVPLIGENAIYSILLEYSQI